MADEDLALLDWVVASVHNAPDNRPTERVLEAMENPYVDCIGHLTGRRINKRPPRDVDVERVIEGALETGTLLEINGQPDRLDLRDVARARREGGGAEARRLLRRAPDPRAGLRRARGRAGAARLADEGRRRQHAHVEAARQAAEEAPVTDFREDGAAALEWAARYLERVDELPVLAQVEAGRASRAAAGVGARAARAVRGRAPRPRRAAPAGAHELAEPALLLLLRGDRRRSRRSSPSCSRRR